ncbi:MAG: hypothetical protein K0U40_10965, partial [Betaproteobacteria bacterium]|nr:hypothetical protein [Betaproteobacteria bacterium]
MVINKIWGLKKQILWWEAVGIKFLAVTTILWLLTGCAQHQRSLSLISPIDLETEKSIPVGEVIIFGRVNVVINEKSFVWDDPLWDKFYLYLISDSDSEPIVYPLLQDGTFSWHLPPGNYTITSFRWSRARNNLIRPVFASFSVSGQLEPVYIGELVINFIQTGPPGYSQKIWKLPRDFPEMYVVDNYQQV